MSSRIPLLLFLVANILIPIALLTFARGFFPYKPFLPGLAIHEDLGYGDPPSAPFDKVIFMVVDALRSDFVYGERSGFAFTQSLIRSGAAVPFTARATSPTITMPRIKAITTGSIPSFLDVILNFAESDTTSTLATQDTWIAQMKAKASGKLVMHGDDTWIKLFPNHFDRADGTSSFFVADFTEVDNNVTRHVAEELKNTDWNTVILHYLGLDHIGHKAGPRSPNMIPKQEEMDAIIRQIYEAILTEDHLQTALLVLCGDHGMNDAGNHGGSSAGETSPALLFISPKLKSITSNLESPAQFRDDFRYYSTVEQSDIVPTLAALLGFPFPRNNLGALIPDFLSLLSDNIDRVQLLLGNAKQILQVVTATFPSFEDNGLVQHCETSSSDIDELSCSWREVVQLLPTSLSEQEDVDSWQQKITVWLRKAQNIMSNTASNYDTSKLGTGLALAVFAFLSSFVAFRSAFADTPMAHITFLGIDILYGVMMFASSYVEEEQHFWYWSTTAWLAILWIQCTRKRTMNPSLLALSSVLILLLTRISQRWNQTGQKHAGEPDIARAFFYQHRIVLWTLIGISYLSNLQILATRSFPRLPSMLAAGLATALATASLSFKLAFISEDSPELLVGFLKSMASNEAGLSLVTQARIIFIFLGLVLVYALCSGLNHTKKPNPTMRTTHDLLTLLLITQSRATNIPLLLIFEMMFYLLNDLDLDLVEITTTSLLFQYMSFFVYGGSNAISSIDLSSAYNGVSGYNVLAVGVLTFVSNWTGPIFWTSATNLMLLKLHRQGKKDILFRHLNLLTVFTTSSLIFVMVACTVLRSHLFIWTVFSPKYLYSMAWGLGQHLCINIGLGSLLYWLGTKFS